MHPGICLPSGTGIPGDSWDWPREAPCHSQVGSSRRPTCSRHQPLPESPRHARKRLLIGQLEGQPDELPWQQKHWHLGQRVANSEGGYL